MLPQNPVQIWQRAMIEEYTVEVQLSTTLTTIFDC